MDEDLTEDAVLTDEDNEPTDRFLSPEVKGFFHANGETKLNWSDLGLEAKRVVYVFDAISGLRYYLNAQLVDGYLKITTEMI